jgi:hypothetical protein
MIILHAYKHLGQAKLIMWFSGTALILLNGLHQYLRLHKKKQQHKKSSLKLYNDR